MKNIRLFLIRHGRQSSSDCNVNVSLAPEGIEQAKLVGKRLKNYGVELVYSSHLIRAVETASYIRKELGLPVEDAGFWSEDLREMDYGELTGLPDAELRVRFGDYFAVRDKMEEDICIPGGENGEMVCRRMTAAMNRIIVYGRDNHYSNIAVVSHGGAIRSYLAGLMHIPQPKRLLIAKNLENCSITELMYHIDTGNITIERINDYSHLEGNGELLRRNWKEKEG